MGVQVSRVLVTGMGCVSGLGLDAPSAWNAVAQARSAIRPVDVPAQGQPALVYRGLGAPAPDELHDKLLERFGRKLVSSVDRVSNLAALAVEEALADAGLTRGAPELETAAIVLGSASGGNASIEAGYQRLFDAGHTSIHPLTIPRCMGSAAASHVSMVFGIKGVCHSISSACASSAHAIEEGMHLIRAGRADLVIAGGSDASLTYGSLQGWRSLQAASEDGCRPFARNRNGTVVGEGAAVLVLESEASARARGAQVQAEILGAGSSSDARHLTQPDSDGAVRSIRAAYLDAGLPLSTPVLISAHGTGTILNDRAEAQALGEVFGDLLSQNLVIATKSAHGHLLGASGAIELLIAILALRERTAPEVIGIGEPDPECAIPVARSTQAILFDVTLSTSFAFGGLNCALLARRP